MAHGHSVVTLKDVPAIVAAEPLHVSPAVRGILWLLVAGGLAAFIHGITGEHARLAWISLQVNFTYWLMVAMATAGFSAVFHICNAQWARPLRRVFEASGNFLFYLLVPLVVLYFGHDHLFEWAHEDIPGKGIWLTSSFVYTRDFLALVVLILMVRRMIYFSVRKDVGAIRSQLTGISGNILERWKNSKLDGYVEFWGDNPQAELKETTERMSRLSPLVVIFYALVMSLIAFDQIMSVDPHWYSTLFGAYYFMSAVYVAMAWMCILVAMLREMHPLFRTKVFPVTLHDLGKLFFGFGIFWAYLFWSHYLTIWYGNLPEETGWVITRLRAEPWHAIAWLTFACCFIIPFFVGLSLSVKKVPTLLFALGVIVACGLWLQQYLLFAPTLYPDTIPLGLVDIFLSLGFMGAYLLSVFDFLKQVPLMPFGDFYQVSGAERKAA